jgi:cell wall assembly regulator SMI1
VNQNLWIARMHQAWKRIENHLLERDPDALAALRPAAPVDAIREAEAKLGVSFPKELTASLLVHDGQDTGTLFDGWSLLGVADILEHHGLITHLLDAGEFADCRTRTDKRVREGWYRRGWLPVLSDGFGNLLCVDTEPSERGKVGQLVTFWHDDERRPVVAASLDAWLKKAARELARAEPPAKPDPVTVETKEGPRLFRDPIAAQRYAVRGFPEAALAALREFAARGDVTATASISLFLGYAGDWEGVLRESATVLYNVGAFYHCNVPDEHAYMLVRAAELTGNWARVGEIARDPNPLSDAPAYLTLRTRLLESARQERDLLHVPRPRMPLAEGAARWAAYQLSGVPSTYSRTEQSRRRHRFLMAVMYGQRDEALALLRAHPESCEFRDAVEIFDWQQPDDAWSTLLAHLDSWMPVYYCQIAPSELLCTPGVRDLMTPARCAEVLATPRARSWWDFRRPA